MTGTRWQCPHGPASCIECMEDGPVARQAFNARHPGVCERCDGQIVIGDLTIVWPVDRPVCTCPEGDVPDDENCPLHGEDR